MKRYAMSLLVLVVCFAPGALGQESDGKVTTPVDRRSGGLVRGDLTSLRFVGGDPEQYGRVDIGSPVLRRVIFLNTREVAVRVTVARKSCSCFGAQFDKEWVAPGEKVTLSLSATATPSAGETAYFVEFLVDWEGAETRHQETGVCYLRFTPDISFVVRPQSAAVAGFAGQEVAYEMSLRSLAGDDIRDWIPAETQINLPGWRVTPINKEQEDHSVAWFRIEGVLGTPGLVDTEVLWQAVGAMPTAKMDLRLLTMPPYRVFPGGAVFVNGGIEGQQSRLLKITSAPQADKVADVRVQPSVSWLKAELIAPTTIEVVFAPMATHPNVGKCAGELLDENGNVVFRFPIVWWFDNGPVEPDTRPGTDF